MGLKSRASQVRNNEKKTLAEDIRMWFFWAGFSLLSEKI